MVPELDPNPNFGSFCNQKLETRGENLTFLLPDPIPRIGTQTQPEPINNEDVFRKTTVYGKFSQVKIETRGRVGMLPFGFTLVSSREVHPPHL